MGMFDYLYINKEKLPLSEEDKEKIEDNHSWQTKDFDCYLTELYITDEGELKINRWEYEEVPKEERPYPDDEGIKSIIGSLRRVGEHLDVIPYHGYVRFYSGIKKEGDWNWFDFSAKFTDGRLEKIERVE